MKKSVAVLLCLTTFLSLSACNGLDNSDDIDNTKNTNEETTKASDATSNGESDPTLSELSKLRAEPTEDLPEASIWRAKSEKEYYIYIKDWDVYRKLPGLASYNSMHVNDNCIIVDSETATISVIHQYGKNDEPIIITYHINRSNSLVESYAVPLNIKASSEYDTFFVNMLDEDYGYYFLTPRMDGTQDWRMDGVQGWPLFMFETTNGGKSWKQISTNTFTHVSSDYINLLRFVSPQVGIISFRYVNINDLCDRTYLTVDGGLTWNKISQLPYPFENMNSAYSEVVNFEIEEDTGNYYLTVEVRGRVFSEKHSCVQIKFWSEDLINWKLC